MKDSEESDALWDLLGKASRREPSPFFARKVLRAIREESPRPFWPSLLRWLIPASVGAAAAIVFAVHQHDEAILASEFNEVFDEAASLDSLVVYDDVASRFIPEDSSVVQ